MSTAPMRITYSLVLEVDISKRLNAAALEYLDETLAKVLEYSTAREAIEDGLDGALPGVVNRVSLRHPERTAPKEVNQP